MRSPRSLLSLSTVTALAAAIAAAGCASDVADTGTVDLTLVGEADSGNVYRLRSAELTIVGPETNLTVNTEDDLTRTTISNEVPAGSYAITLGGSWHLERLLADGTAVEVEAALVSPNPLVVTVSPDETTRAVLLFQVTGESVGMGNGDLDVDIDINEPVVTVPLIEQNDGGNYVEEGQSTAFAVWLASAPTAPVTYVVTSNVPSSLVISPATVTFTPANWSTRQILTATALADSNDVSEEAVVTFTAGSQVAGTVEIYVADDDWVPPPGIGISPFETLTVPEGGTKTFQVYITNPIQANVVVNIASSTRRLTVSPATLTFTPANRGTMQTVTVTNPAGSTDTAPVELVLTAAGLPTQTLPVFIQPPWTNMLDVSEEWIQVLDGTSFTIWVVPELAEDGPLFVNITSDNPRVTVSPSTLTFAWPTWFDRQPVTVTTVGDANLVDESAGITFSSPSTPSHLCVIDLIEP